MSRAFACAAMVLSLAAFVLGCGPGGETGVGGTPQPTGAGAHVGGGGGEGGGVGCPESSTRDCTIDLGRNGDVLTCFHGTQTCKGGEWGPCENGETFEKPAPRPKDRQAGGLTPLSLSMAQSCASDCDPSCQHFDEVPADPVESTPVVLVTTWESGSYGDLPSTYQDQGSVEPCNDGADCQFDQYCNNPSSGTCAHSKCVVGDGLQAQCDPCVQQICQGSPGCCNTPIQGTCAHDLCTTGGPLKYIPFPEEFCDPCVKAICTNPLYQFCCNQATGAWTQECVNQVDALCAPKSCNNGTWSQGCVDKVKTLCNAHCLKDDTAPVCPHHKCDLGDDLDSACDPCVAQVCAIDPFCCINEWDGLCVSEVESLCGETCPTKGECVPWLPTETDPTCFGYDLTIGVGCTGEGGALQVPVCNHGTGNAPAGLPIAILPPAPLAVDCYTPIPGGTPIVNTPAAIPPGQCIDVTLPAGTAEGSRLGANLFHAPGYNNSECHCSNNWSIWSSAGGACGVPSCAGASSYAKLQRVKLFFTVDKSASLSCSVSFNGTGSCPTAAPTRWDQIESALTSFLSDPASDELGVWMRFWPYSTGASGSCPGPIFTQCSAVPGCRTANVDVPDLTAANEAQVLATLGPIVPGSNSPMYPALEGAHLAVQDFLATPASDGVVPAVVLVTDGSLATCSNTTEALAALASQYFNGYGIRTYIIGIAGVSSSAMSIIAGAGGGKAFFIEAGQPITGDMLAALNEIKQEFVSCTIDLPDKDSFFDPDKAVVTYTPGAGAPTDITEVASLAACGGGDGWYFDDPGNPDSITLCPATCTAVKADPNGALEVNVPCLLDYDPAVYTQKYEAICPPGKAPQWGYLTYDSETPGDSYVEFRVRTSPDDMTYGALPAMPHAVARATPDTQICALNGPLPDCPVNLYEKLGLPDARNRYLELVMDVHPTSDTSQTPSVNNWQVTYSCPDAE